MGAGRFEEIGPPPNRDCNGAKLLRRSVRQIVNAQIHWVRPSVGEAPFIPSMPSILVIASGVNALFDTLANC